MRAHDSTMITIDYLNAMWNCELAGWIIKCAFWWQKESLSNETQVTLEGVRMDAAGVYSCEVSADAPSFQTATVHGYMDIVGTFTIEFPTNFDVPLVVSSCFITKWWKIWHF